MKKQVKMFEAEYISTLEEEVNEFINSLPGDSVVHIEHSSAATTLDGIALRTYSALVIYELKEVPKNYL